MAAGDQLLLQTGGNNLLLQTGGDILLLQAAAETSLWIPDPRWEEPNLLIPGKKPTGPVVIDWSHPLARGLYFAYLPRKTTADPELAFGDGGTQTGTQLTLSPSIGGMGANTATASGNYIAYDNKKEPSNISIVAVVRHTGGAVTKSATIVARDYNGSSVPFHLSVTATLSTQGMAFFNGAWRSTGTPTDIRGDGEVHAVVGTYDGSTLKYFLDGKLDKSASYSGTLPTGSAEDIDIGSYANDSTYWHGDIYAVYLFDRALSDAEIAEISRNPYAFLIPA